MRTALVLAALASCGPADWDRAIDDYEEGLCTSTCRVEAEDTCRRELRSDLAAAKDLLDPAGEQRCIACLDTRLRLIPVIETQGCHPTAPQETEILEACGANDEVCAGAP